MAGRFRGIPGGIDGLLELILHPKHGVALEADLIRLGLRSRWVGEDWFTWCDLKVIVRESGRDSALFRTLHPQLYQWDHHAMLMALMADSLQWLAWAKTKDGQKGRNMPDPIPRPGVEGEAKTKQTRGQAVPLNEFKQKLEALRKSVMEGG